MIECFLKNRDLNDYIVILPHEINNEFLFDVDQYTKNHTTEWGHLDIWASDFWSVEFPLEKLDKLYNDFEVLENNLDEITKIVPLPEKVWNFDWMFYAWYRTNIWFQNRVALWTWWYKNFDKEDMIYLISLIKKKILEAKEKWEALVFSGD